MALARGGILAALLRHRRGHRPLPPCPSSLLYRRSYSNKLFVGGLSFRTDEEAVRKAFSQHGDVVEVKLITDRETGRPKGFGFVTFNSDDAAENARSKMTGQLLDGRMIRVDKAASSRPSVASSSFGGMGSSFSSPSSTFSGSGTGSSAVVEDWGTIPSNAVQFGETASQSGFPSNEGLNTTTFGSSNTTTFGSSDTTTFGSSNTTTFGSSNTTTLGSSNTTTFGSSNTTSFSSSNTTSFSSSNTTSSGTFDAASFGSASSTSFGSFSNTGVGSTSNTSFGTATVSTTSSTATTSAGSGFTSSGSSFGVKKTTSDDWGSIPSNSVDLSSISQTNTSGFIGVSNQDSTGQSSGGLGGVSSGLGAASGVTNSTTQQTAASPLSSDTSSSQSVIGSSATTISNSTSISSAAVESNTSTIAPSSTTPTTPSAHPLNSSALTSSGSFNFSNFSFDSTSYRDNDPPLPRRRPRPRPRTMNQSSSGMGLNLNSGTNSILETMSPFGSNNQYAETSIPKFKGPEYDFGLLDLGVVSKSDKRPQGVFDIDIPEDLPEPPPPEPPKPKPAGLPLFPQKTLPSLDLPWDTPEADNWSEIGEDPPKYDLSSLFPSMGELIKKEKEFHWDPYDFDEEAKAVLPPEEEVIEIDSDYD